MKDCNGVGCARGWGIGLSPDHFGDYDHNTNTGEPESVFVTVHEIFHKVQGTYFPALEAEPAIKWVKEGQARAIQDLICSPVGGDNCVNVDADELGNASYHGELNDYLDNPNQPINAASYDAAIFWTFLAERYGTINAEPEHEQASNGQRVSNGRERLRYTGSRGFAEGVHVVEDSRSIQLHIAARWQLSEHRRVRVPCRHAQRSSPRPDRHPRRYPADRRPEDGDL